jgi:hypothetical protein
MPTERLDFFRPLCDSRRTHAELVQIELEFELTFLDEACGSREAFRQCRCVRNAMLPCSSQTNC